MKLLHISAQLPSKTGSGVYFSNLIKGLQSGHEQACIYGVQGHYEYAELPENRQYPVRFQSERLPFPIVGMSDVMPYENTRYGDMTEKQIDQWLKEFEAVLERAVYEFKPDIILCHHLWMLTSMVRRKYPNHTVVGFSHGTDLRQSEKNPQLKKAYVQGLDALDMVFALSPMQVDELMTCYGLPREKIVVMGGGFDQSIFYPPTAPREIDRIMIVFAGKIAEAKGVFQLLQAFRQVSKRHPDVYLEVIGSRDEEAVRRIPEICHDQRNIIFYNLMDQHSLSKCFRDGHIFVMPSFFEGLGLVAIEALACDMRVVSTHIEGLEALLGDEVNRSGAIEYINLPRLHDVDRPYTEDLDRFHRDLADAICLQIERIKQGQEIPQEIKDEIYMHSWDKLVKRIESVLKDLV